MKNFLKILVLSIVLAVCAVGLFACGGDDTKTTTGLVVKKFNNDDTWTVCDYNGEDKVIDIAALAKDEQGNPVTVGRILKGAFSDNDTITKVIVPGTVTKIDAGAFKNMGALKELVLPFIGGTPVSDGYFNQTDKSDEKSVDVERTFAYIFGTEEYEKGILFTQVYNNGENNNENYYLPATLNKITIEPVSEYTVPMFAFAHGTANWTHIEEIVLGDNVIAIGDYAFNGFVSLKTINLNKTAEVGEYAFAGCTNLKDGLTFGDELMKVKDYAFSAVAVSNLVLPQNLTSIGKYAFFSSKINTVTLPSSLAVIPEGAFAECMYLNKVIIKNSSTVIHAFAFDNCTKLSTFGPEGTAAKTAVFSGYTVFDMAFSRVSKANFDTIEGLADVDKVFFSVEG